MAFLIDTCVAIDLERRAGKELGDELGAQPIYLSAVSASELLHGVHRANTAVRRARREAFVEALLTNVPVLAFDLATARVHARIWADLRSKGDSIGAHDLLIASTAAAHSLRLLTGNVREFVRIPGLEVVDWTQV